MAIVCDAAGEYLTITSNVININAAYTVAGWLKRTSNNDNPVNLFVIDHGSDFDNLERIFINSYGQPAGIGFSNGAVFSGTAYGPTNIDVDTWYHIAMVRESTTSLKLYVNGVLEATLTDTIVGRAAPARMSMAAQPSGTEGTIGAVLAAWNAWNRALTSTELLAQMAQAAPTDATSLYAEWLMLAGAGRINDASGNGHPWTANGTLTDTTDPPITYPSAGGPTPGTMTTNTGYWGI